MPLLKVKVSCFRCHSDVTPAEAIKLKNVSKDQRYECYKCYKKNKTSEWGFGDEVKFKSKYYCQRCNYKFKSKKGICPYCNQADFLVKGKISVHDLL